MFVSVTAPCVLSCLLKLYIHCGNEFRNSVPVALRTPVRDRTPYPAPRGAAQLFWFGPISPLASIRPYFFGGVRGSEARMYIHKPAQAPLGVGLWGLGHRDPRTTTHPQALHNALELPGEAPPPSGPFFLSRGAEEGSKSQKSPYFCFSEASSGRHLAPLEVMVRWPTVGGNNAQSNSFKDILG